MAPLIARVLPAMPPSRMDVYPLDGVTDVAATPALAVIPATMMYDAVESGVIGGGLMADELTPVAVDVSDSSGDARSTPRKNAAIAILPSVVLAMELTVIDDKPTPVKKWASDMFVSLVLLAYRSATSVAVGDVTPGLPSAVPLQPDMTRQKSPAFDVYDEADPPISSAVVPMLYDAALAEDVTIWHPR